MEQRGNFGETLGATGYWILGTGKKRLKGLLRLTLWSSGETLGKLWEQLQTLGSNGWGGGKVFVSSQSPYSHIGSSESESESFPQRRTVLTLYFWSVCLSSLGSSLGSSLDLSLDLSLSLGLSGL